MAVDDLSRRVLYVGDGSTTEFAFNFVVFVSTDVAVYGQGKDGEDSLIDASEYSVALNENQDSNPGGKIVFNAAPSRQVVIAIVSAIPEIQPMVLTTYDGFDPEVLNKSADRAVSLIQQLRDGVGRAIKLPRTSTKTTAAAYAELANAANEANKALALMDETIESAQEIRDALEEAGDIGGVTPIVASGGSTPRTLSNRFADIVNAKDYGALGDGTADDTAALAQAVAASNGGAVFLPFGDYRLTSAVSGTFVSFGGVTVTEPYATVLDLTAVATLTDLSSVAEAVDGKIAMRQAALASLTGKALLTLPDFKSDGWNSAIQGMAYDKFAGVLYAISNWRNQSTFVHAFDYATNTLLGTSYIEQSGWNAFFGGWSHQSFAVYRPAESDPPGYFFAGANTFTAPDVEDNSRAFILNLNHWDYAAPATYTTERYWTLFDSAEFNVSGGAMNVCLSEDGSELCAKALRISDNVWVFAVWDAADILAAEDGSNVFALAKQTIASPWGSRNIAGQGTAIDKDCIYCLYSNAGNYPHQFFGIDRKTGAPVFAKEASYEGFDVYGDTTTYAEAEALAFLPAGGSESHLCLGMQCIGSEDGETRTIRLYDLETGASAAGTGKPTQGMITINGDYIGNESSTNSRTVAVLRSNRDTIGKSCAYINRFRNNDVQGSARNSYLSFDFLENGTRYQGAGTILHFANGELTTGAFGSFTSNPLDLGSSISPWVNTYLSTDPIITSDERVKQDIEAIPEAVLRAWGDVEFLQFRYRDAVAKKGTAARLHTGVIAQRVKAAFEAHGIDPFTYGILCRDEWDDAPELGVTAGDKYSVRYEEALVLECAYQRWRLAKIEEKLK